MNTSVIDAYRKIENDRLYNWLQSLESFDGLGEIALDSIKKVPRERIESWYTIEPMVSKGFYDDYVKYKGYSIRIANLFECFLKCSDWKTTKKIIQGYSTEQIEIGNITVLENGVLIGEIGQKSDLIWSAYYDSFVQEDDAGYIEKTLSDDESILSIQIWNIEDGEENIENKIKSYLLDVSVQTGMKFEILYPVEVWKERGDSGHFSVETGIRYESTAAAYINYGMNTSDSRVAYLHLYEGIEYFFYKAEADCFRQLLGQNDITQIDDKDLVNLIRNASDKQKEYILLDLVLKKAINVPSLRQFVNDDPNITETLKKDYGKGKAIITNDLSDDNYISHLTTRIYLFRCAIAHAKGEFDGYMAIPDVSNQEIEAELPLMRYVAYEVLKCWSQ